MTTITKIVFLLLLALGTADAGPATNSCERSHENSPLYIGNLAEMNQVPAAVERLGSGVFVKATIKRIPERLLDMIFFNFDIARAKGYWFASKIESLEKDVKHEFGYEMADPREVANSAEFSNGNRKTVWVDKQIDPMGIAMDGNAGSGRAGYVGKNVNLKGIGRTPLAKASKESEHGHGWLDTITSIWEAVASDALFFDMHSGTSPVLSVLNRQNRVRIKTEHETYDSKTAIVSRIDEGALDRPVHIFVEGSRRVFDVMKMAEAMGRQEGEKFVHGLVHGAFSAGNISKKGHFLDMDTVRFVFGRHPQYSLTGKYVANSFGLEWKGQLQILETVAKSPKSNPNAVPFEQVRRVFEESRARRIEKSCLDLAGIPRESQSQVYDRHTGEISAIANLFRRLASKSFPNLDATFTQQSENASSHVFDFSNFFRKYPLLRANSQNPSHLRQQALRLLRKTPAKFEQIDSEWVAQEVKDYLHENHFVKNSQQLAALEKQALEFIDRYESFYKSLIREKAIDATRAAVDGYVANENRFYLTDSYGLNYITSVVLAFDRGRLSKANLREILTATVRANRRINGNQIGEVGKSTDARIFKEGKVGRIISDNGQVYHYFQPFLSSGVQLSQNMSMRVGGKTMKLAKHIIEGETYFISSPASLQTLQQGPKNFEILNQEGSIKLTDFRQKMPSLSFELMSKNTRYEKETEN